MDDEMKTAERFVLLSSFSALDWLVERLQMCISLLLTVYHVPRRNCVYIYGTAEIIFDIFFF